MCGSLDFMLVFHSLAFPYCWNEPDEVPWSVPRKRLSGCSLNMLSKLRHFKVLGELSLRIVTKIKCEIRLKYRDI